MDHTGICTENRQGLARNAAESRWHKRDLTWGILGRLPGIKDDDLATVLQLSWNAWSRVCNIRAEMADYRNADVRVRVSDLGDPGGVLADMQLPVFSRPRQLQGRMDVSEKWIIADNPSWPRVSVRHVMEHEFGHALGIGHGGNGRMFARYQTTPELDDWSIDQARQRYGPPQTQPVDPDSDVVDIEIEFTAPLKIRVKRKPNDATD